jgi:hypothetical protein
MNGGALYPDLMNGMKIGALRFDISWGAVEPARGQWNWASADNFMKAGPNMGLQMIPMLGYTAGWAVAIPGKAVGPPKNTSDWTDFVTAVVKRYTAAPYNAQYFQVWNEPTKAAGFWAGATDMDWVDQIYIPAARAIRENGGRVVFGGWPQNGPIAQLNAELQHNNAWQVTDILDIHYLPLRILQQVYSQWVATGKCKGVWETEVGAVNNPVFLTNLYSGVFNWAKTSGQWSFPDQYKLFWYPGFGAGCPACLATPGPQPKSQVLTPNGQALQKLAQSLP